MNWDIMSLYYPSSFAYNSRHILVKSFNFRRNFSHKRFSSWYTCYSYKGNEKPFMCRQDPVSTMQKTDWTKYSPFLVWSGQGCHLKMWCLGAVNIHYSVYLAIHGIVINKQTNEQRADWSKCKPALDQWEGSLLQNTNTISRIFTLI